MKRKKEDAVAKTDWLTPTEKALRITYWVTKIGLAVAWAKEMGLLDWWT